MKKWLAGFLAGAIVMVGAGAFAATPGEGEVCVAVPVFGVEICGVPDEPPPTTTTTTLPPTTTTTVPPTTTTTVPPTTTTTVPPTTTTTVPPTTTTTAPPFVLPPTRPFPEDEEFNGGESFRLQIQCTDDPNERDPNTEPFECPLQNGGSRHYADLDYFGHGMPYLYSDAIPGNHDHAWWVPGDRQGYACAYGFMYDRHPNPFGHPEIVREGHFIARATVVRPLEAGYGKVNDVYMEEGERYYDGTISTEGQEITSENCQTEALDPFDYDNYVPHGPDQIRIGLLTVDGEVADIRDFTNVLVGPLGHFEFLSLAGDRASVLFILDGQVSHVIYYDALNDGQLVVEVDGQIIDETG